MLRGDPALPDLVSTAPGGIPVCGLPCSMTEVDPTGSPQSTRERARRDPARTFLVVVMVVCVAVLLAVLVPGLLPLTLRSRIGIAGPQADTSGAYAFLAHQPGDPREPVAYSPCTPIRVQVNPDGGPADAVTLVQQAMARVATATGLRFEYAGASTDRPQWRSAYLPDLAEAGTPVLVSWATPQEVPELAGAVAGIGGSVWVGVAGGTRRYVTGAVTLDTGAFEELGTRPDARAEEEAIVLHEFGHLVGLGHVDDPGELMYRHNIGRTDFGPGDLAGLALLGQGSC